MILFIFIFKYIEQSCIHINSTCILNTYLLYDIILFDLLKKNTFVIISKTINK